MSALALLAASAALSSLAVSTARIELPADLAERSKRIEFAGFGGFNKGDYRFLDSRAVAYSGEFTRSESRLGIFDPLLVKSKANGSFTFADPESESALSAACDMRKVTVNVDIVTLDTKKMAWQCEFRGDAGLLPARLVIGQAKRRGFKEKILAKDLRQGESAMFDRHLLIESVHDYRDSKFSSQPPLGYLLRSGDRTVAAVELTDLNPGVYLADDLDDNLRRAVLVTALAIAVFRDPANSALEPD